MITADEAKQALNKLIPCSHDQYEAWFFVEQYLIQQQLKEKKVGALLDGKLHSNP